MNRSTIYKSLGFGLLPAFLVGCPLSPKTATESKPSKPAMSAEIKQPDPIVESSGEERSTPSGLRYIDQVIGSGATPQQGQIVSVHYTGRLKDGQKFDSSRDRGKPFEFTLGVGQVIKGWDEGLSTMQVGGKRKLIIPPDLGYGSRGVGSVIPPNSELHFDVELLGIK